LVPQGIHRKMVVFCGFVLWQFGSGKSGIFSRCAMHRGLCFLQVWLATAGSVGSVDRVSSVSERLLGIRCVTPKLSAQADGHLLMGTGSV